MTVSINSNITALRAVNRLGRVEADLSSTYEKLASGQRINRASDDSAGLAIASQLEADTRIYTQAIRNGNDGISLLNIADNGLRGLTNIVQRLKELATQSANGVYSSNQRLAMDREADALVNEYNRVLSTTKFNDQKLIDGSLQSLTLQLGKGSNSTLSIALGQNLQTRTIGDGTFNAGVAVSGTGSGRELGSADINGDGRADLISGTGSANLVVYFQQANGTFSAGATLVASGTTNYFALGDFNGDSNIDIASTVNGDNTVNVFLNQGNGTFATRVTYSTGNTPEDIVAGDINGDSKVDLVAVATGSPVELNLFSGVGNGTFTSLPDFAVPAGALRVELADLNNDNKLDVITTYQGSDKMRVSLGNGDGTFQTATSYDTSGGPEEVTYGDFNGDGYKDIVVASSSVGFIDVFMNNRNGTFGTKTSYSASKADGVATGDFNGDGYDDIAAVGSNAANKLYVLTNQGNGTFGTAVSSSSGFFSFDVIAFDKNGDGVLDLASNSIGDGIMTYSGNTTTAGGLNAIDLTTRSAALDTLDDLDTVTQALTQESGNIGSFQSRLITSLSS